MNSRNQTSLYIEKTILLLIILAPIFSVIELTQLFTHAYGYSQGRVLTPIYIKILKDILVLVVFIIIFGDIILNKKINSSPAKILPIVFMIVMPLFLWSFYNNPLVALSGVRWMMYFILGLLLVGYIRLDLLNRIAKVLYYLFLMHFMAQIFEMLNAIPVHGFNILGLAKRNPGLFIIPNTGGFFSVMVMYFAYFYLDGLKKRNLILCLAPISIFLTSSATSLAVLFIFLTYMVTPKKYIKILPMISPIIILLISVGIGTISGRSNVIGSSFGIRVDIFMNLIDSVGLFSSNFGAATQTAVLIVKNWGIAGNALMTDSTYGSILANFGFFGFTIFMVALLIWGFVVHRLNNKAIILFTIIYCLFGLTTSITEAFPMNILFAILMGYYIPMLHSDAK